MNTAEARRYFGPEDVERLEGALDAAWAAFSSAPCSEANRTHLARYILMGETDGERDPEQLRDYAIMKTRLRAAWLDLAQSC